MATTNVPVTLDTPIVIKVLFRGHTKKFKLPLKDLGAHVLPEKLRTLLQINADEQVVLERYSDSSASYVTLDSDKPQVYKTLFRAAKAKLKLRLRATVPGEQPEVPVLGLSLQQEALPSHVPSLHRPSTDTLVPQAVAPTSPVIVRSPAGNPPAPKLEPISPVSPPRPVDDEGEAPVPRSFTSRQSFFNNPAKAHYDAGLAFRPKPNNVCTSWVVYCNNCNHPMEDEHFHCSVCDGGDYDLCPACVDTGVHCPGTGHWMVKRFVKNGDVVYSTTQRIPPKIKTEDTQDIPGAYTDEKKSAECDDEPTRTCNCCVKSLPEKDFVTCLSCEDYDLCMDCHMGNKHGHHPGHAFTAAASDAALPTLAGFLCNSGRNVRHSAVCDGCDKFIYGVRHKCLNCPDWDYCSNCVKNAKHIHPRHRFVPIYEPLAEPLNSGNRHYGIYCDGPLCNTENASYIEGIRYKCAVCHDTDFCQNCEAHPSNRHNHTHPLIKFKTPVRSVSVTTVNDDKTGQCPTRLGDHQAPRRSTATETTPTVAPTNAATQVQTIVDLKPSEESPAKKEKIAIRDLLVESVEPMHEKVVVEDSCSVKTEPSTVDSTTEGLDAHFIRDTILDGTKINACFQFVQVWTLRNPGPNAWPAGCSVRHIGGDNMLNIDNTRPLSHAELADASESNVVGRLVEAGEEISFRVIMKAPQREGTAISYWRLKTADGIPFGHRLWCDINVVAPPSPSTQLPFVPAAPAPTPATTSRLLQSSLDKMQALQLAHAQHTQQCETVNMATIQRARKAAVERMLENRRREHEAALATIKHEEPEIEARKSTQQPAADIAIEAKPFERAPEPKSSGMIFPQLDKESPESSTYESTTTAQPCSPRSEMSITARTVTVTSDDEFFEDAESVALHSDDEGFETDEEYDILDASDEEMP